MSKKPLYLTIPLAAALALTGCSGSANSASDDSPAAASSSTPGAAGEASTSAPAANAQSSSAPPAQSAESGSSPAAKGSDAGNGAALSDTQLKKAVTDFFDEDPGAQILSGKTLRAQAGAAGAMVEGMKISPEKCNSARGIDIESELKKNNIAVGTYPNPEDPMQSISITIMSAGDPAETQATFDEGIDALDDCQQMDVELMGIKTKMKMEEAKVTTKAPSSVALRTVITVQGTEIPGSNVSLLDDGLQVQLQVQGKEADQKAMQNIADEAQRVLDSLKSA
ncbi:hypothetical protein CIK75_08410 [Glutamicibacter sp. BW78]|uniref:hypothetical protein n=1 Tax=Glutamicibacter sp. BW78 TaxID=2024403 RepID=UPI000BB7CECB|nr:hypothetical protein [Glutamicibacter sp. BW78]PCC25664.1 hypothetical protein CIK75_08410 [Glutamicibacter sp. BW78]